MSFSKFASILTDALSDEDPVDESNVDVDEAEENKFGRKGEAGQESKLRPLRNSPLCQYIYHLVTICSKTTYRALRSSYGDPKERELKILAQLKGTGHNLHSSKVSSFFFSSHMCTQNIFGQYSIKFTN